MADMFALYRCTARALHRLMPFVLERRARRNKEDRTRRNERLGSPAILRPSGILLWVHAASVGEANSALPLLEKLLEGNPSVHALFTTGTVTSATLVASRLPVRTVHQYVPVDTPQAVENFISHWKPDIALWVESEFWPNLIFSAKQAGCQMVSINTRISERSCRRWGYFKHPIRQLLGCFSAFFPQSQRDAERLASLGAKNLRDIGNLKYDTPALGYDTTALEQLKEQIAGRRTWLAASTHPGEEQMLCKVHSLLKIDYPDLLTIIVPRHPQRGSDIAIEVNSSGLSAALRSKAGYISPQTDIYIADTLGELGLFYRLTGIAFIGGSLVRHGGQNMLEAAKLGCATITGPHIHNFQTICEEMQAAGALCVVNDMHALAQRLMQLFKDKDEAEKLGHAGESFTSNRAGISQSIIDYVGTLLKEKQ